MPDTDGDNSAVKKRVHVEAQQQPSIQTGVLGRVPSKAQLVENSTAVMRALTDAWVGAGRWLTNVDIHDVRRDRQSPRNSIGPTLASARCTASDLDTRPSVAAQARPSATAGEP